MNKEGENKVNHILFALCMFLIALAINMTWIWGIKICKSIKLYKDINKTKRKNCVKTK